ncbi:hypothetical protein FG05_35394 [Fusarium graminearum]|nr:hypothetical protein FG05_35394 [Fusarium graminearum]
MTVHVPNLTLHEISSRDTGGNITDALNEDYLHG